MSDGGGYELVLPFDSDDEEFTRGWEAAEVWHDLTSSPFGMLRYERMIHTSNLEMALRMAERAGWSLRPEAVTDEESTTYDDWTTIVMERLPHVPDTPPQEPR